MERLKCTESFSCLYINKVRLHRIHAQPMNSVSNYYFFPLWKGCGLSECTFKGDNYYRKLIYLIAGVGPSV